MYFYEMKLCLVFINNVIYVIGDKCREKRMQ